MELNKIIRRTGVPHSAVYTKFVADLTDATKDVNGMTKEEVKEVKDTDGTVKEKAHTRFYLDATKTKYIKVVTDASCGMRVQFTCSSNTIDIDGGSNSQAYAAYNIAKTAYGFMFTTIARVNNATTAQSDGTLLRYLRTRQAKHFSDLSMLSSRITTRAPLIIVIGYTTQRAVTMFLRCKEETHKS